MPHSNAHFYQGRTLVRLGRWWVEVHERAPQGESGDITGEPFTSLRALKVDIDRQIKAAACTCTRARLEYHDGKHWDDCPQAENCKQRRGGVAT